MAPIAIPSCNLSPEQKEILIDAVRQRPAIWNCTSDEYNDIGSRKNAYSEVAALLSNDAVQYSAAEMQTEWKKMRDIFNRTLKKVIAGTNPKEITWRYWHKMQFIAENEKLQILKCVRKWNKMARKYKTDVSPTDGEFPFKHLVENGFAGVDSNENFSDDGDLGQETSSAQMTLDWLANYQCPSFNIDEPDIKTQDKNAYMNDNDHAQSLMEPNYNLPQQNGPAAKRKRTEQTISPSPNGVLGNSSANSEADIFGAFIANKLSWISSRNFKKACQLQKDLMEMVLKCQMEVFETQTNHDL
uniref:MADF domain-containing protein n=1 Tax=Acrobeloides nanus TaxID=290746 RepID=A0A914C5D4_9BILA